jgi:hypothetical protein
MSWHPPSNRRATPSYRPSGFGALELRCTACRGWYDSSYYIRSQAKYARQTPAGSFGWYCRSCRAARMRKWRQTRKPA